MTADTKNITNPLWHLPYALEKRVRAAIAQLADDLQHSDDHNTWDISMCLFAMLEHRARIRRPKLAGPERDAFEIVLEICKRVTAENPSYSSVWSSFLLESSEDSSAPSSEPSSSDRNTPAASP